MPEEEICFLKATELAYSIRSGKLSAAEVMEAHLDRVKRSNPKVNAIVTFTPETAMERACPPIARSRAARRVGLLHELPIAHKDLLPTEGILTTFGSPISSRCGGPGTTSWHSSANC